MSFVNTIAEILYSTACEYVGYPNKNIGDAFLLVYKISDTEIDTLDDGSISIDPLNPKINNLADLSIISVLKTLYRINTDIKVRKYNKSKRLNKRMGGFRVKLGFGVHFGWAIEGALGSCYKIDTTYSSSHVNLTMHLESLTKHYGSTILLSGDLYDILSIKGKKICRGVDQLFDSKSNSIIRLFCIDVCFDSLKENNRSFKLNRKKLYIQKLVQREINIKNLSNMEYSASLLFELDDDIFNLCVRANPKGIKLYKQGLKYYIFGNWDQSKSKFESTLKLMPDDGPTKAILRFMKVHNYKAPADWNGCRRIEI